MEWYFLAVLFFGGLLLFLFLDVPVGFAFGIVGFLGLFFFTGGEVALRQIPRIVHDSLLSIGLLAIPLFVLMAELLETAESTTDLYTALEKWLARVPGSLGVASVGACAIFAAASGSSLASAAAMGRVTLRQMLTRGFDRKIATGAVAAGGTLALMIPPSLSFILYGLMTETSIGKLFIGGIIPGIFLAVLFALYIVLRATMNPGLAPALALTTWTERWAGLKRVWAVALLIVAVLGSIYVGIATPTEAAAIGVVLATLVSLGNRRVSWGNVRVALFRTVTTTGLIMLIVVGAQIFTRLLALSGVSRGLASSVEGLGVSPFVILMGMTVIYLILGMLMDGISILLLTLPVMFPIAKSVGIDPIWFGIYTTLLIEVGLLTPPVGLNCYIIADVAKSYGVTLGDVFQGALPFVLLMLLGAALLIGFPQLALWLPATMR
jgi:tripartite ATP-independent transporter DctM subunit